MRKLRQMTSGVLVATVLTFGLVTTAPAPLEAQQAGLVNVQVGSVNVLNNVNLGLAIALAADVCGNANIGVLAVALQRGGPVTCTATSDSRTGNVQQGDLLVFTRQ